MPSANTEKERMRHPRSSRYLTRVGQVAIFEWTLGNLAIQMATFRADVNIGGYYVNMKGGMST
jgi:hypothetical protein